MSEKSSGVGYGLAVSALLAVFYAGAYVYLPQFGNIYQHLPDIHSRLGDFVLASYKFWVILPALSVFLSLYGIRSALGKGSMNVFAGLVVVALALLIMSYFSVVKPIEDRSADGTIFVPQGQAISIR